MRLRGLAIALFALGCSRSSTSTPPPPPADAAAPVASAAPDPDAPPSHIVDLVYTTKTLIAVSTKVDNPRDYPEHLVDNKPDTAWNSATGDLKGWIAIRVPKDAHVDTITITAGFDKIAKDGLDLFTANHRIKRVKLSRDGVALGEHTLDTEVRTPQKIAVDKDGGEFKIEVLETVPGTKTAWRELVVSELHVLGKAPAVTRGIGERPRVLVGSFDAVDSEIDPPRKSLAGAFPDVASYCRTQRALVAPTLPAQMRYYKQNWDMDLRLVPACAEVKLKNVKTELRAPFLELSSVKVETGHGVDETLVVRTEAGWRDLPALALSIDSHFDPGCASIFRGARLVSASLAEGPTPVLLLRWSLVAGHFLNTNGEYPDVETIELQACRLAGEAMACDEPVTINEAVSPQKAPTKWRKDAKYTVTPDGHIKWQAPPSGPAVEAAP